MVDSWCEVKIDFLFVRRNGRCGICDNRSDKIFANRFYERYGRSNHLYGEELRWFFDEHGNLFIRSPPAPLKKRLHENFDDCRCITRNIADDHNIPVVYYQYIQLDNDDIINDIYENARTSEFDIIHRGDVFIEIVKVGDNEYLRLSVTVYRSWFVDKVLNTFYKIIPEEWLK